MLASFVWFDDVMSITNGDYLNSFDVGMNSIGYFNRIVIEGCDDDVTLSTGRHSFDYDNDSKTLTLNLMDAVKEANSNRKAKWPSLEESFPSLGTKSSQTSYSLFVISNTMSQHMLIF